MSTTNTTTGGNQSNLQFNPISQGIYNNLTGTGGNALWQYITSPFNNPSYNAGSAQSQAGAKQAGANNTAALQQNMLTSGIGGVAGAGFKNAQGAQTNRANQSMTSQANISNVIQALQRQMSAAGSGLSYSPQLTGQSGTFNQNSTQNGLGTFLPQLLSSGLGAAMGAMNAGSSGQMNAAGTAPAFDGGVGSLQSAMNMPSGSWMPMQMAGMGSSGLAGMMPTLAMQGGSPSPFMSMFNQPQGYNQ